MNNKVKAHLEQYAEKNGWGTDMATLIEAMREGNRARREEAVCYQYWNVYRYVVEVDGMYICYYDAESTGDASASEQGYEFDPDLIHEVKPVEKTITVTIYVPVG